MDDPRYDELEDAIAHLNPEDALAFLLPIAESGDPAAQCLLADEYDLANVGERDTEKSVSWLRKSAAQGYLRAQYFLGSMIAYGMGTAPNFPEAAYWFRICAERGDSAGQFRLGEMLARGEGVKQDMAQALEWLERSAAQEHPSAIELLEKLQASI
jgi:TPR repeat protein